MRMLLFICDKPKLKYFIHPHTSTEAIRVAHVCSAQMIIASRLPHTNDPFLLAMMHQTRQFSSHQIGKGPVKLGMVQGTEHLSDLEQKLWTKTDWELIFRPNTFITKTGKSIYSLFLFYFCFCLCCRISHFCEFLLVEERYGEHCEHSSWSALQKPQHGWMWLNVLQFGVT